MAKSKMAGASRTVTKHKPRAKKTGTDDKPKVDAFDVAALEKSLNDSATRVSTIWISFVIFAAYLAAAASNISHRQLFLEDAIKLPTVNIDLPLFASALLLPTLFVVYHVYVLLQIVLLARTAVAYEDAIEQTSLEPNDQDRLRQRLPNTLFAQIFAGSARERKGTVGALLKAMAWISLAVGPILVLLLFEIKFLPYHSDVVTWLHRLLIVADLLAVFLLWAGAIDARHDINWTMVKRYRLVSIGGVAFVLLWCLLVDFPGEPHSNWIRRVTAGIGDGRYEGVECRTLASRIFPEHHDRIILVGEDFVQSKPVKPEPESKKEGERHKLLPDLKNRDFRCAIFIDTKLPGADFSEAFLERATFHRVETPNARFHDAHLQGAEFIDTKLDGLDFTFANLQQASLVDTSLRGARMNVANLQGADLTGAKLDGAILQDAKLQGASISNASLRGASLADARLEGVNLYDSVLRGADLSKAWVQGGYLHGADLQGADLSGAILQGTNLTEAQMQGSKFSMARRRTVIQADLKLALIDKANVWRAAGAACKDAYVTGISHRPVLPIRSPAGKTESLEASPPVIGEFTERATQTLSPAVRKAVQKRLGDQLNRSEEESEKIKNAWDECAERWSRQPDQNEARKQYEAALADYLTELACDADEPYIVVGVYRWWIDAGALGNAARQRLAAGLLGANAKKKSCTGGLAKTMRESLRRIAAGHKEETKSKEDENADN